MADPRGGPSPAAQEVVLSGPFKGFDSDTSQWFLGPNGVLNDCSNVDILKGQIVTRPGIASAVSDLTAVTNNTGNTQSYPSGTSVFGAGYCPVEGKTTPTTDINAYGQFWSYQGVASSLIPASVPASASWTRYQYQYVTGQVGTVSGNTAVSGSGTTFTSARLVGAYFKIDSDSNSAWTQISAVNAASGAGALTLASGYAGSTSGGNVNYTIAIPIVEPYYSTGSSYRSDIAQIPNSNNYVVTGSYGSRLLQGGGTSAYQTQGSSPDLPVYLANCAAFYANRLFLGTDFSAATLNAAPNTTVHGGRIAWSRSGVYTTFSTTASATAGAADLECSSVRWLVVLRDILYAFSPEGIFSIEKTGNSSIPFRIRQIVRTKQINCAYKPVSMNGAFVYVVGYGTMFRFDGSSLEPVNKGADEFIRGYLANSSSSGYPNATMYDALRDRVFVTPPQASTQTLIYDVGANAWLRWSNTGSAVNRAMLPWFSVSSNAQAAESVLFADATVNYYQRTTTTDAIPSASTAISWSATSGVLDTSSSRDKKSCNRIRITYEATTASTNNITATLYVDGGTTAAYTSGNINLAGTNGAIGNAYVTFAPIAGQQFTVKLSGSSSQKVKINQIALNLVSRQEAKPT